MKSGDLGVLMSQFIAVLYRQADIDATTHFALEVMAT